ncbi:uncharacterized protein V1518DRAFT_411091 [Limtongia smithiae]|uniref:uncharacterized protein n=1 Tax=Limtongia smithiae TaxID=1125753 RepID=UPI0034CE0A22
MTLRPGPRLTHHVAAAIKEVRCNTNSQRIQLGPAQHALRDDVVRSLIDFCRSSITQLIRVHNTSSSSSGGGGDGGTVDVAVTDPKRLRFIRTASFILLREAAKDLKSSPDLRLWLSEDEIDCVFDEVHLFEEAKRAFKLSPLSGSQNIDLETVTGTTMLAEPAHTAQTALAAMTRSATVFLEAAESSIMTSAPVLTTRQQQVAALLQAARLSSSGTRQAFPSQTVPALRSKPAPTISVIDANLGDSATTFVRLMLEAQKKVAYEGDVVSPSRGRMRRRK